MERLSDEPIQPVSIRAAWTGRSSLTIPSGQSFTASQIKQLLLNFSDSFPWGVLVVDEQGNVIFGNTIYWQWLGLNGQESKSSWLNEVSVEQQIQVQQLLQEMKDRGFSACFDFSQIGANGKILHLKAQGRPCFYEDGLFYGIVLSLQLDYQGCQRALYEDKDKLTGLPNRLTFYSTLEKQVHQAEKAGQRLAVIILDLDRFKRINETFGHERGDALLIQVAERLAGLFPPCCRIFRLGGDEFVILVEHFDHIDEVCEYAQLILHELAQPFAVEEVDFYVTASIGISSYPADGQDGQSLMKNADTAMYRAKAHGKNNYLFYRETMNSRCIWTFAMENRLRKAIQQQEFLVHYQPQMNIQNRGISGIEALVRWLHPEVGIISPAEFIPLAEESGLILNIGRWVMKTACSQLKAWQTAGYKNLRMSVNISPLQFQQPDLIAWITDVLENMSLDPQSLELEITESLLMQNPEESRQILKALAGMGLHISVDDFGTGYSSLSYLKHFPINTIKIDRTFINGITSNADDQAIATAVTRMAHSLNMNVVAEGVETETQLKFLQNIGCDCIQGYLFSKPVSAGDFTDNLRNQWKNLCTRPI